jgi:hypothetical protein
MFMTFFFVTILAPSHVGPENVINVDVARTWQGKSQKCHKTEMQPVKAHVAGRLIMSQAQLESFVFGPSLFMIYDFLAHIFFS